MGVDYYKILQVDKSAKDEDLKRANHKLAIAPWQEPNNKKEAEAK